MTTTSDDVPDDLLYSTEHQWLRSEGGLARVGITAYAQDELGDVVYVSLPKPGDTVGFMEKLGEIESVKVLSEFYSPASGEVVETNAGLDDRPELLNQDPYGEGWLVVLRMTDATERDKLLTPEAYRTLVRQEQGRG